MPDSTRQLSHHVMVAVMLVALQLLVVDTSAYSINNGTLELLSLFEVLLRVSIILFATLSFIHIVSEDRIPENMISATLLSAIGLMIVAITLFCLGAKSVPVMLPTLLMVLGSLFIWILSFGNGVNFTFEKTKQKTINNNGE
jgi:hypothetical protein